MVDVLLRDRLSRALPDGGGKRIVWLTSRPAQFRSPDGVIAFDCVAYDAFTQGAIRETLRGDAEYPRID